MEVPVVAVVGVAALETERAVQETHLHNHHHKETTAALEKIYIGTLEVVVVVLAQ